MNNTAKEQLTAKLNPRERKRFWLQVEGDVLAHIPPRRCTRPGTGL